MALMCNGYRLGFSPFRYRAGALVSIYTPARMPCALYRPGALRSTQFSFGPLAALPQGNRHPAAWMLPQQAGGMASHNRCTVSVGATGDGALGRNMQATATVSIDATALGGLIAGGVGTATITITASGDIVATIGAPGTATISVIGSADVGALGWLDGLAQVSIDGSLVAYAIGHMSGTTEDLTGLTPASVASAVWAAIATDHNEAGTMGAKLNAASSAGDPWGTALPGSYPAGSAGAIVGSYLADVWRRLGLGATQTTSQAGAVTTITDGTLTLTITEQPDGSVTVERA